MDIERYLVDGATIYLLWQSNRILAVQGPPVKPLNWQAKLRSAIRYWPMVIMALLAIAVWAQPYLETSASSGDLQIPRYLIAALIGAGVMAVLFRIVAALERAIASTSESQEIQGIICRIQQVMVKPQIRYVRAPETLNQPSGNLYTHLRFRNRPPGRDALDVEARIRWATENGQELLALLGKWQEVWWKLGRAMHPANGIKLASDDKEHALDLCIRKPNSPDFYAVDIQGAAEQNSYVPDCLLKSGTYNVFVSLSCDGYVEKFVFKVALDGTNPPQVALIDGTA